MEKRKKERKDGEKGYLNWHVKCVLCVCVCVLALDQVGLFVM